MASVRGRYQGTWNVVRFNWHFYLLSTIAIVILISTYMRVPILEGISTIVIIGILSTTLISLLVTYYIYDKSSLYELDWLKEMSAGQVVVNINAGFDETSSLIKDKIGNAKLVVFDFYDKESQTEISIKRARKAYPPYPNTEKVSIDNLPMKNNSVDMIIAFLSAHEIRDERERYTLFTELKRIMKFDGQVIIIEHLRDLPNFIAYNIGFLHFHSRKTWIETFDATYWNVEEEKITPFITKFTLRDGDSY